MDVSSVSIMGLFDVDITTVILNAVDLAAVDLARMDLAIMGLATMSLSDVDPAEDAYLSWCYLPSQHALVPPWRICLIA